MDRRTLLRNTLALTATAVVPSLSAANARPPFKLYDTHAHFYGNQPDRYPFNASGARNGAEAAIAKAMARPMTPEVIFGLWDAAGVELGCGVQYNTTYASDNRYLLDVAASHPQRIVPVVILPPTDAATPATLARMARDNRISGVRFTGAPNADGEYVFLSKAAEPAWQAANTLGLTVVLMPGSEKATLAMTLIAQFAARYPNVNIVLDHIGFPKAEGGPTFGLSEQHLALARHPNVYYKYTTLLIERMQAAGVSLVEFVNYVAGHYGADHLVWGSDVGNTDGDYLTFVEHALASASGLAPDRQQALFYETARKVFVPGGRGKA